MEQPASFTTTLVRMLQNGAYQEWLQCADDQCTKIEFRLQQIYHVHVAKRHIVIREQDIEVIRRHNNGKWQPSKPTICHTKRIILDRASGKILETPQWGVLKARQSDRRARSQKVLDRAGVV